jgi:hypothetical protein
MIDPLENTKHENSKSFQRKWICIGACSLREMKENYKATERSNPTI